LQRKFAGKPLPPLYGIPFTIQRFEDYAEINALANAGAMLLGSFIEASTYVAALSVSFALDRILYGIDQAGASTSISVFHPTPIDSRPLTHRELVSTAIVAQSSEEARNVWLAIKQYVNHEEDTFILPPSVIDSWV
jgi:hypothetical protein